MFTRILVANRGEIAVRIIRSCHELGIEVVAIYSEEDRDSLHVRWADRALCIGPPRASASYLNGRAIVTAAIASGAQAIHPGYGFLAENAAFAAACEEAGLVFIGPSPHSITTMGHKAAARGVMQAAGVQSVPGSDGVLRDLEEARELGDRLGYPLLIKAVAGGGGRGMRVVGGAPELSAALAAAQAEALATFGNGDVYIERLLSPVRHVEVQLLADTVGTTVQLGERDCSAQRRRQKLVEEAPAPNIGDELRQRLGEAAIAAARAVEYRGAGTVEFIVDPSRGAAYFMEMNTRIQVEHPVTEILTGIDIVREQLRIAAGEPLGLRQADVCPSGHALECRVNAEDPSTFLPSAGSLTAYQPPGGPGVRVDSHCYPGMHVSPFYDSLLAKLIVWAPTREQAIMRMQRALDEYIIEGVQTTMPRLRQLLRHPRFQSGNISTDFVDSELLPLRLTDAARDSTG